MFTECFTFYVIEERKSVFDVSFLDALRENEGVKPKIPHDF